MKKEILRLFKGYLGEKTDTVNEKALKYGLLIPNNADEEVVDLAIEMYGKDGEKWNQTFHKDFEIVKNAPMEDLIAQQMIHYITTYGFESLGMYDSDLVYIPREKLEIPELDLENIEFITIKPLTSDELTEKLMTLVTSGIGLSEQTVEDVKVLSDFIDKNRFDEVSNREIKTYLYDKYNIMPKNPDDFLRYMLFKLTGNTLKIQSVDMIYQIRRSDKHKALKMLESYLTDDNSYKKLSSIFLRNKQLFLALKVKKEDSEYSDIKVKMNRIINKLRKMSVIYHKPLPKNILDNLTDRNTSVNYDDLVKELDKITIFREMRILNGIRYRLFGNDNIVYRIRNGKSYVSTLPGKTFEYISRLEGLNNFIMSHLISRLSDKVKGKTIYIPENVIYAVPTSEKQFFGDIPEGSYIEVPRNDNIVYGVHWKNIKDGKPIRRFYGEEILPQGEERVDLDLKQMNKSDVFGWDASYRSSKSDILFSGDITNAQLPDGATELFYVGQNVGNVAFLVTLNMFTNNSQDVPFEFVIANATHRPENVSRYALDPNNILYKMDAIIKNTERQKTLGLITISDTIRFYFNEFSLGNSVATSRRDDITMGAFDYLNTYGKTQLKLNELLKDSGAIIVNEPTIKTKVIKNVDGNEVSEIIDTPVDLDLSLESITKDTIIDLFS